MMFIFITYLLVGFGVAMGTYEGYRDPETHEQDLMFAFIVGVFWIITVPSVLMHYLAKNDAV